ncbi:MAG TPA: hypothetical protein VEX68_23880, partial [Bryobacteraceae bacterium]|nr:hypothetical protein [Bryobacteraceae bacterium]
MLSTIGGWLFQILISALGAGNPSLESLLRKQLEAIGEVVSKEIRENEIRRSLALLESIRQKMTEYMNAPTSVDRLENATAE